MSGSSVPILSYEFLVFSSEMPGLLSINDISVSVIFVILWKCPVIFVSMYIHFIFCLKSFFSKGINVRFQDLFDFSILA